jgi:hypothetical protein
MLMIYFWEVVMGALNYGEASTRLSTYSNLAASS